MRRGLSNYEQETIINFNKDEAIARIFSYEKAWQQHLEKRLGLKPTMDNGFGGKGYEIDFAKYEMDQGIINALGI